MRRILHKPGLRVAALLSAGFSVYQIGGCSPAGVVNFASQFNPCGSLLNCDPLQYNFLTSGYEGPGARPEIDIFCSFPPFCAADDDPLVGGGGGG